ncbi:hypothetical protein [Streptomyces lavendulae]|uniref:hypothetical protein n=1 Tax=Streptomyces lavendulae TaxID=1914 RepID=UPI002556D5E8|nr:hypothetical protein [Streptomyces lavendulae]
MTSKILTSNVATVCGWWAGAAGALAVGAGLLESRPPLAVWALAGAAAAAGAGLAARALVPLWAACGLSVTAGCTLLMDVIALLFGQRVDSVTGAVAHALGLVGALLTGAVAMAVTGRRDVAAGAPTGPPGRWIPYLGVLTFLPYVAMKLHWAQGGTFAGVSGAEVLAESERNGASGLWLTLERWGLDATVLMALVGILLLFCLIRPWGLRLPRWLPLTPALIGTATLVPYGLLGLGYLVLAQTGAVGISSGAFHSEDDTLLVAWIGYTAFSGYGVALLAATRWYWGRTREHGGPTPLRRP